MKTGEIREKDAKGCHTTTYREMIELPNNVVIIDTPGMFSSIECGVFIAERFGGTNDYF